MRIDKIIIFLFPLLCFTLQSKAQVVFSEDFEGGVLPSGWGNVHESGTINWSYATGGNSSHPAAAHGGTKNALFFFGSYSGETTKLVTTSLDLSAVNLPVLKFWHTQDKFGATDQDQLKVYYKNSAGGAWALLTTYTNEIVNWAQESISLPNKSATYFIAFEARTGYGYGVCIDDVTVEQTPSVPKSLSSLTVHQASENYVLKGSSENQILRIDMDVAGNSGSLLLNSVEVNSLNTNDNYISANGVKLFITTDSSFTSTTQVGTSQDFVSGKAVFSSIAYDLPPGLSYLWITYDISPGALPGLIFDAYIDANKVNIDAGTYPAVVQSPAGNRVLLETIFQDNFETDKGWTISGEFERAAPQSLGGAYLGADPPGAYNGLTILGTDLSGLGMNPGDYEPALANQAYTATSPVIGCKYYTGTKLRFSRWLNIEVWDKAYIEISNDSGATWQPVWMSFSTISENTWSLQEVDVSYYADNKPGVVVRFSLGTTDGTNNCSGWNIDDVVLTGDFINPELSVGSIILPVSGCNLTATDSVRIIVNNHGGQPSNDTVRVCFSPDGGLTVFYDTIFQPVPMEDSVIFTFRQPVDLSSNGTYDFFAAVLVPGDKQVSNDTLHKSVTSSPQFMIPYFENFENGQNGWFPDGINSSWQFGTPASVTINSAASGIKAWKTNLNGGYNNDEISYVQSPCFNFTGITDPYLEFRLWWKSEPDFDGAAVFYSVDDGVSWDILGSAGDMLNWYNFDTITSLQNAFTTAPGWSYESFQWVKVQHQLPSVIANNPGVKFRFVFASNNLSTDEGFAFDDVAIYDDQPDMGVTAITAPVSACDLSAVEEITAIVKNFGSVVYNTGDTIRLGLIINGLQVSVDTVILSSPLVPGASFVHLFQFHADFQLPGDYIIDVYTLLSGDLTSANNHYSKIVSNFGHPVVSITGLQPGYCSNTPGDTLTGNPSGGIFSGSGISGNIFSPSSLTPSVYQVIYTYSDTNGCAGSDTLSTEVFSLPVVDFGGLDTGYCENAPGVILSGVPPGGSFSGPGITGDNFFPVSAGTGSHVISYLFTDGNNCSVSFSKSTEVFSLPVVFFTDLNAAYCPDAEQDTLTALPPGGVFSGPGMTGDIFDPALAGTGTFIISYLFTDNHNCSGTASQSAEILILPVVGINGLDSAYCVDASAIFLTGSPSGGVFSGPGISGNIFEPIQAGPGDHSISYNFTDSNSCSNTALKSVSVYDLPVVGFTGLDSSYCIDASADSLTGTPSGGVFTGQGITGDNFNPALSGSGSHIINYVYSDANNCSNSISGNVIVLDLPVVDFTGMDPLYCVNAPDVSLTGLPLGGVFTGPGISGGVFSPAGTGTGTHQISYFFTDTNTCSNSVSKIVVVAGLPVVGFSGLDPSYCENSPDVILSGLPAEGVFNGNGVTGDIFSPSAAGTGAHILFYTFTDTNSCSNTASGDVDILALPVVSFSGLDSAYCAGSPPVVLTGFPSGGVFSGSGVTGGSFSPVDAGTGNFVISYLYTDTNNCSGSTSKQVGVLNLPVVDITNIAQAYCTNSGDVALSGIPSGGTFSGTGITGNVFSPVQAGLGTHIVNYLYSDNNNCSGSISASVEILNPPDVNFSGLDPVYCLNANTVALTGSPSGGFFTGTGLSGYLFTPSVAGAGIHAITYNWSDTNNCTNSAVDTVEILSLPFVNIIGLDSSYCLNSPADTLTGIPPGGIFSGQGITGGVFSPFAVGTGNYSIMYQFSDSNNCTNTVFYEVEIFSFPAVDFSGLDSAYCIDSPDELLSGFPEGGIFSGTGISGDVFSPGSAGPGVYNILYTYADSNNCSNSVLKPVAVNDILLVGFSGLDSSYCGNHNSVILLGTPSGGTFTGNGITNNVFDPVTAGTGYFQIVYTYSQQGTCLNSDTQYVYVRPYPVTGISGLDSAYCKNDLPVTLSGIPAGGSFNGDGMSGNVFNPSLTSSDSIVIGYSVINNFACEGHSLQPVEVFDLPQINFGGINNYYCFNSPPDTLFGNPPEGIFSGNGVAGNVFYPSLSGIGEDTIYFSYTDLHACTSVDRQQVLVYDLPQVSATGLDPVYCIDHEASILQGTPAGGIFSGGSMGGNMFIPGIAGTGNHSIIYSYSDANGCVNRDTLATTVFALPQVAFNMQDSVYCKNSLPVTITGIPPGGVFSGNGVSGNLFKPELADTGGFYLSYTYTDLHGCNQSDSSHVFVVNPPDFTFAVDTVKGNFPFEITAPAGFVSYLWEDGSTQASLTVTNPGWYAVTVTTSTGCSAADSVYAIKTIGIDEIMNVVLFSVYPNPAQSFVNISLEFTNPVSARLDLINAIGEKIFLKELKPSMKVNEIINLSETAGGIYTIRILTGKHYFSEKLIVK